jgi:hypothetical protein
MKNKGLFISVDEIDRERRMEWGRNGVFTRRKGIRQPAEIVRAKSRARASRWRYENDKARRPETVDVAMALLRSLVRTSPDLDSFEQGIVRDALLDLHKAGYRLPEVMTVCKRMRERVLAEEADR